MQKNFRLAIGIIVFNGDFVLEPLLNTFYPYVDQILISEGCVEHFQQLGHTESTDKTNEIIHNFPDPDNKIKFVHGVYKEKTEQANAYMKYLDADYLWQVDSDELYMPKDIEKLIEIMPNYTSIGVCSTTFFGGFDHYITGFEAAVEYKRIFKVTKGSMWRNHRPPQIDNVIDDNHLDARTLKDQHGITMRHYSYVWPRQVKEKVAYYKAKVSKDNCLDDYFEKVWLPWVNGTKEERQQIEAKYKGVHEFKPSYRREAFTSTYYGDHPPAIIEKFNLK